MYSMKVIVVGSGGREHAISWKLAQSPEVSRVICVPGNGGTAREEKCVNVASDDPVALALQESCSLAVIGPEDPLAQGIADRFWQAGIPCVGPKSAGAQLEASKNSAKEFMRKYGVACARSRTFTDEAAAEEYIRSHGAPVVVKADGLAAGKGVVVAATVRQAVDAAHRMLAEGTLGAAGRKIVVEDYLQGTEISVLAAVSVTPELAGEGRAAIVPFTTARDHKRLYDGAQGPNTGGMGAVAPVADVTEEQLAQFNAQILEPTLRGMIAEGYDYRGFIFFGLMLTEDGPRALEYNVRLGDPETQAVLPLMDFDFAALCRAITDGTLKNFAFRWKEGFVVAPVAVSGGYPASYRKGMAITFDKAAISESGAKMFIAGAAESGGQLVTSGGRVLACSAYGSTFDSAWKQAYLAMQSVHFDGMFYRRDIGLPGAAESGEL